jgi:hypothetical protein
MSGRMRLRLFENGKADEAAGKRVTRLAMALMKLPALQLYQLNIPAPPPPDGSFNRTAAALGQTVFNGKAQCSVCHVPPTFNRDINQT